MTNGSLMISKVLQNAPLEHSAIFLTCILETQLLVFFLCGCLRQVLLYMGKLDDSKTLVIGLDKKHF